MKSRPLKHFATRGAAAAALLAAASLPAMAEGLYVGGSIAKPDWHADDINGVGGSSSGTGLKVYGGWQFHPNFAVEASAFRLGRSSGNGGTAKADGFGVDAVGLLPFAPDWTAFAKLGVASVKTRAAGDDDRNTVPKFGLGVQYKLTANMSIRGEWERYRLDAFDRKSNTDQFGVGVNWAF